MTSILKALIIPGITYTQKLFVRCSPLNSRNVGIMPPFTYMVTTQNNESCCLNRNLFRLTMYARIALVTSENTVPTTVLATVM